MDDLFKQDIRDCLEELFPNMTGIAWANDNKCDDPLIGCFSLYHNDDFYEFEVNASFIFNECFIELSELVIKGLGGIITNEFDEMKIYLSGDSDDEDYMFRELKMLDLAGVVADFILQNHLPTNRFVNYSRDEDTFYPIRLSLNMSRALDGI